MISLQNELSAQSNAKDVGKHMDVLVEGRSKRSDKEFYGRTSQNKVVVFPRENTKAGDFVTVLIDSASSATLRGHITDPLKNSSK